jgi:hypothetical protein
MIDVLAVDESGDGLEDGVSVHVGVFPSSMAGDPMVIVQQGAAGPLGEGDCLMMPASLWERFVAEASAVVRNGVAALGGRQK